MSEFFYKERLGPQISPVIKVKQQKLSPTVVSAIDNLLSPNGDMFKRAETVRNLMSIEKMNLEQAAKALSLNMSDVANKLRLLEFSDKERELVLKCGFSESSALCFLSLDKVSRLYAMEYCRRNDYSHEQIAGYVEGVVNSGQLKRNEISKKLENIKKLCIGDINFFLNSVDNAVSIARRAGFDVESEKNENHDCYRIAITVKKQKRERQS